jgi:single-stranded-DNA-specific exonuclease
MFELSYFIHSGKQHGITKETVQWVKESDLDLLFVPDGGSGDFESHKELRDVNVLVCVLDHHESDGGCSLNALVVNSLLSPEYINKQFSGVGIVYKTLQALDDEFGFNGADDYLDLSALGNIADVMDLTSPETRYYVYEGINNLKNEVLKELIFQNIGKWDKVNPTSLAFNVIPKINGLIRAGTQEEKIDLFEAMIGHGLEEIHENPKARTESNKTEVFLKKAVRQAKNAHARQNTAKKRWVNKIKEKIKEEGLENNIIIPIIFKKKDKFDNKLSGVIASSLTNFYQKPILILTEDADGMCRGSMRGFDSFTLETKSLLSSTGLFEYVQGHENAAGVAILKDNIPAIDERLKLLGVETVEFSHDEKTIEVDFELNANQLGRFVVDNVAGYQKYWGKGLEQPLFAIKDIEVDFSNVKISSGGAIKFEVNGVEFTQFSADKRFYDLVETDNNVTLTVVGTLGINEYMGKETHQCVINHFKITKVEDNTSNKYKFIF